MKKLLILTASLFLATSLFAQNAQILRIATFPFSGSVVTNVKEGEYLAGLFTSEFIPLGYTLVTRTTGLKTSSAERSYQTSGATAEIAEIGKQVAADYVMVGDFSTVFGQMSLKVEVIGVESSQIVASETQRINNMNDLDTVAVEMVKNLNSQIKGKEATSEAPQKKAAYGNFTTLTEEEAIGRDLKKFKRNKWIGRWTWIGGIALMGIGGIVMGTAPGYDEDRPEQPRRSDYGNNNFDVAAYNDAYRAYSNYDGDSSYISASITLMTLGGAAILSGAIVDGVFSSRENKLLKKLESEGVYFSIAPDFNSDSLQLAVKYSF